MSEVSEVSEAAKREACRLANELNGGDDYRPWGDGDWPYSSLEALARVLQEHSDIAKDVRKWANSCGLLGGNDIDIALRALILPDEPDPLEAACRSTDLCISRSTARMIAENLDAAGYEIRRKDAP